MIYGIQESWLIELVRIWLGRFRLRSNTHYTLQTCLRAGGDSETIKSAVVNWLQAHIEEGLAGYLFKTWLEKSGDYRAVEPLFRSWYQRFATKQFAWGVRRVWYLAGGTANLLEDEEG